MTFSTGFSSKVAVLLVPALLSLSGCAGMRSAGVENRPEAAKGLRVAVLPVYNLSGSAAPLKDIRHSMETMYEGLGMEVVGDEEIENFMARHRIRYSGGLGREASAAIKDELRVDLVLISSLEFYSTSSPPKAAMTARLVTTGGDPEIRWIDGFGLAGDDSPGLLGLGLIQDPKALMDKVLKKLSDSASAYLSGKGGLPEGCPASSRFRPKISYRSPAMDARKRYTVVVLPFLNNTDRNNAGEIIALEFVRQLWQSGKFEVMEPGVVRDDLLSFRIILEGGVSFANAEAVLETLNADMALAGNVLDYEDYQGAFGKPKVSFSAVLVQKAGREVVWESRSYNEGDDGVFFFDRGRVNTAEDMSCRMVKNVVEKMTEEQ